ncbi:MAG: glycosyltransferase, partial [Gemmatimonadetes bacterium]|nr:glycosyltransferase [Gemmatimonadota bacterium]
MTTSSDAHRVNDAFPSGDPSCDLTVVIPSYNTRDLMEQALRTVEEASADLSVETIVVDNASQDGSQQMVRERFPDAVLICNEKNLGFAGANNLAFRRARGRHILLLNSDTIVRADTLHTMVSYLDDHPEVGAAGCKVLNPDGTLQLDCRRAFPTPSAAIYKLTGLSRLFPQSRRFARYNLSYLDEDETAEVDALSGSFMLVRRETLQQVGGLDEAYFMYGEDLDWCFRMREAGWKIYYVPTTQIIHFRGQSGRSRALRVQFRKNEAMAIFVHKHMRQRYRFFPVWLLHAGIIAYSLYAFLKPLARRLLLPLVDAALLVMGLWLGIALRYHPTLEPVIHAIEGLSRRLGIDVEPTRWLQPPAYSEAQWLLVYAAPVAIWLLTLALLGLYDRRRFAPGRAALGVGLGFAVIITTVFFFKDYNFSRLAAAAAWGCNTLLVAGWRWSARQLSGGSTGRLG